VQLSESKEIWQEFVNTRICFTGFQIHDMALFYQYKDHYLAFSRGPQRCFLSDDSARAIAPAHMYVLMRARRATDTRVLGWQA
jgi:hypothetical protein